MLRGTLPPISNRETFTDDIQLYVNRVLLDPTGITAKIQLEMSGRWCGLPDYVPYYNYGSNYAPRLLATTENGGISIVGGRAIRFTYTLAQMQTLESGQYQLSAQITSPDGARTLQLFQLQIPVLDGGVPTT